MGLSDAINNLVSSLKGNTGAQQTNSAGGDGSVSVSSTGNAGGGGGAVGGAAEVALGNQLANISKEPESAKSVEDKASAALEDLMGKLGLSGAEEEQTLGEIKDVFAKEIESRKDDTKVEDTEEVDEASEVDETEETDEGKSVDDKLDEMTDEELQALYDAIEDKLEFSPEEANAYAEGEVEVKERIEDAVKNNPDKDPAEIEAQIREAYELENPEYADAKKEADAVMEKYDKAMDEEYNTYCEENPQPALEDFDSPEEYAKALGEWASDAEKHMNEAEHNYLKENENYRNLKWAELNANSPKIYLDDPIVKNPKIIWKGPFDSTISKTPKQPIDSDISNKISQIIKNNDPQIDTILNATGGYDFEFVPDGNGADAIKDLMIKDGALPGDGSGYIDYAGYLKTLID